MRGWYIALLQTYDGGVPDERYSEGTVIHDARSGAHDLIEAVNKVWGTRPLGGEVYTIRPLEAVRTYTVVGHKDDAGFSVKPEGAIQ